jgi:hypothetical protein
VFAAIQFRYAMQAGDVFLARAIINLWYVFMSLIYIQTSRQLILIATAWKTDD